MKLTVVTAVAYTFLAVSAFADGHSTGDADAGKKVFKKCKSCHMIVATDGEVIQKGGKIGPNLYGLSGRILGSEGYKYSKGLVALGKTGAAWDEASFIDWSADPSKYLTEKLEKKERSKMSFKLKDADDAADIWAYLLSVGPKEE
jgi:cytochrome c|tara:strand:+ start:243 stop:677 length:435 start_codon:yes stop_codon:yes gene_type:complete